MSTLGREYYDAKAPPDEIDAKVTAIALDKFLEKPLPPRETMLAPWLPRAGLAMVHAPRGLGKTQVAIGTAWAVACPARRGKMAGLLSTRLASSPSHRPIRGWPKPEAHIIWPPNRLRLGGQIVWLNCGEPGGNTGVAQRVTFRGNGGLPINPTSPGYIHSAEVESATVY